MIAHRVAAADMRLERAGVIRGSGFMLWILGAKEGLQWLNEGLICV